MAEIDDKLLVGMGIRLNAEDEAQLLAHMNEVLEARVGYILEGLVSESDVPEMRQLLEDEMTDRVTLVAWLQEHVPDSQSIVAEQRENMVDELARGKRYWIENPDLDQPPPKNISAFRNAIDRVFTRANLVELGYSVGPLEDGRILNEMQTALDMRVDREVRFFLGKGRAEFDKLLAVNPESAITYAHKNIKDFDEIVEDEYNILMGELVDGGRDWKNPFVVNRLESATNIITLGLPILFAFIILGIIEGTGFLSHLLAIVLYFFWLALSVIGAVASPENFFRTGKSRSKGSNSTATYPNATARVTNEASLSAGLSIYLLVLLVAGFGGCCRQLYLQFGGFTASQEGYWHWQRFGFAWLVDNGLFNAASIFGWQISDIQATEVWSKLVVLTFNIALVAVVLVAVIRYIRVFRVFPRVAYAAGAIFFNRANYLSSFVLSTFLAVVAAIWLVPTSLYFEAIVTEELRWASAWSEVRTAVLLGLGIFVTGHALWGVTRTSGARNKILAVVVAAGGIAILYFTAQIMLR